MNLNLNDKAAVITGAGRGLGAAAAKALAEEGAAVMVNYFSNAAAAESVVEKIREKGGRAASFRADVSDPAQAQSLIDKTIAEFGRLDILVNNAGITTHTRALDQFTPDDLQKCIAVNVSGILNCTKAAAAHMKSRRYGKIVNIVSFRAYATRLPSPYDISKSAALAFTVESARELAPHNINVVSISPGTAATDMNLEKLNTSEKLRAFEETIPIGRLAAPEDVANLVCFLASDRARHITGTDILICGGEMFGW